MIATAIKLLNRTQLPVFENVGTAASDRAYLLGCWALLSGIFCAGVIVALSGTTLLIGKMLALVLLMPVLILAHGKYRYFTPDTKIADATGGLAMMAGAAMLAGIISHAGLRLQMPLIDGLLAGADSVLGSGSGDANVVAQFFGLDGFNWLLELAYISTMPICLIAMLSLSIAGKRKAAWESACTFTIAILLCSLIYAIFPAIGNIPQAGLEQVASKALPVGAGTFHVATFSALHGGSVNMLDLGKLEGIVTFPSFHMVMALIIARAAWSVRFLRWAVVIWSAIITVSTIPIGGHYLVDLIAGAVLWWSILRLLCDPIANAAKAN